VEARQTERSSRRRGAFAPWPRVALLLAVLGLLGTTGCATYSDRMLDATKSADAGDFAKSIELVEKAAKLDSDGSMPDKWKSETALAVLERATLLQALGETAKSQRNFQAADKELEFLDLAGDTVGNIAKYTFSDSAAKYSASPAEKLSLNSFNMLNYLSEGNLSGARVEARRFTVMRTYLNDYDGKHVYGTMGAYLAGFTMEKLGELSSAMRYYDEALGERRLSTLEVPVVSLAELTTYRGRNINSLLAKTNAKPASKEEGEILVMVNVGRVPHKVPERMPIGLAVGVAGAFIAGDIAVLGYTAGKFVVFPSLADSPSGIKDPALRIDEALVPLELISHIGGEIRREYEKIKPQIIGAAISRMIVRAAAAEAVRAGTRAGTDNAAAAMVAALFTELTLTALDKPDTRSWMFLPNRVFAYRARVQPGTHQIQVQLGTGSTGLYTREVDVQAGGYATVVVTAPR
jgi:hypothetical protein